MKSLFPLLAIAATLAVPAAGAASKNNAPSATSVSPLAGRRAVLAREILALAATPAPDTATLDLKLAQYRFLRETDAEQGLAATPEGAAFLNRLLADRGALEDYLDVTHFANLPAKRTAGLLAWAKIDKTYPESRNGAWRRTAAAIAAVFGDTRDVTESVWGRTLKRELDPVARFEFFRASAERGKLVPYFFGAPSWELAFVVHGGYLPTEELLWAQQMTPSDRFTQRGVAGLAYAPVHYRMFNYRDDSVQHFGSYYDGKPGGLSRMADYGAVCGGISHTGAIVATAHGVPAFTIGQPGHCAYVYKGSPFTWDGGNFVSGWRDSNGAHQLGFWASAKSVDVRLLTRAWSHPGFREALRRARLADVLADSGDDAGALAALNRAVAACPCDYRAQSDRIETMRRLKSAPAAFAGICVDVTRDLAEFPAASEALRAPVEKEILAKGIPENRRAAYLAAIARALASSPASRQQGLDTEAFADVFEAHLVRSGLDRREAAAAVTYAVRPPKAKKGEKAPEAPAIKAPKNSEALVGYLNALAPATDARKSFADIVTGVVAMLPADVRARVTLRPAPPAEAAKPRYDAKTFLKIGEWSTGSVAAAPIITEGWRELEFPIPENLRRPGPIVIAIVHSGGGDAVMENLRLYADGAEADADTSSVAVKTRRPGLFTVELDAAHAKASRLTIRALVADDAKNGADFAGEVRVFDPKPVVKR